MRPLALAALAVLLAGCSLNYVDKTFSATKPFKHAMPGEEGQEVTERGGEPVAPAEVLQKGDVPANASSNTEVIGKTPVVFPNSAPPSGNAPSHVHPSGEE